MDIQVVLVEADEQTRVELRKQLRSQEGIEVASEATNGQTGLVLLESIDVDVAVVDAALPDLNLADFIDQVRAVQSDSYVTESKLLVLVESDRLETIQLIPQVSYCLKSAPIKQIAEAVRQTYSGIVYRDEQLEAIAPIARIE